MRIGMMPIYYASDQLFAISCPNGMIDLAKGILEQEERSFVYFYVMDCFKFDEKQFDERLGSVRNRFVVRTYPAFYKGKFNWMRDSCMYHQDLFKHLSSRRGDIMDAFLNANLNIQFVYKMNLCDVGVRTQKDEPVIVGWNNDATHPIKTGQFNVDPLYEEQSCHAMAISHMNQFLIPYELELALDSCRKFLSFANCKKIRDNAIVEPMGMDFSSIERVVEVNKGKRDLKEFRFFYGGSFAKKKNLEAMVDIAKNMFRSGKPVKFMITTQYKALEGAGSDPLRDPDVESFTDVQFGCDREKFIDKMADGDVFFAFTKNESMGLAYFEMLYSGMIGIFWDRLWLRGLLPDGYPFLVKDFAEAEKVAGWIVENWNQARDMVNKCDVQGFLRNRFGYRQVARRWYDRVKDKVNEIQGHGCYSGWITEIIKKSADEWKDRFDMEYAYEQVRKYSDKGIDLNGRGDIATKGFFRRCVLASGRFVDECSGEEPTFVKI